MRLVIKRGGDVAREVELSDQTLKIGRSPQNDVTLEDPEKSVSRAHAELRVENGEAVLVDLNSQNGLWVGGQRTARVVLKPGVEVALGAFQLTVQDGPPAAPATPTPAVAAAAAVPIKPSDTVRKSQTPEKASRRRAGKEAAPVQPGAIAWLARQPKPLVFGGFGMVMVLTVMLLNAFRAGPPAAPAPTAGTGENTATETPRVDNEALIARHLTEGRAQLDRGDAEGAIRDHFSQILVIDPAHAEALDLKALAEERIRQQTLVKTSPPASPEGAKPANDEQAIKTAAAPLAPPVNRGTGARPAPRDIEGVARLTGESQTAYSNRVQQAERQYTIGKNALEFRDYRTAAAAFDEVMKVAPDYRDARLLDAEAREGLRTTSRENVQSLIDNAARLEAKSEWDGALDGYTKASSIDPNATAASDGIQRVRQRMAAAGEDAYREARQYDALGRTDDAIPLYRRVVRFLSPDAPSRKAAEARLNELTRGR